MQKERDFPAENSLSKNRAGNSQGWKDGALNTRITDAGEKPTITVIGNCNNQNSVEPGIWLPQAFATHSRNLLVTNIHRFMVF